VRATIESVLKPLNAKSENVYRVSKDISAYFATWSVELMPKQRRNFEETPFCTCLLKVKSSLAPAFSFKEAWIELLATNLLPLAKKIAQILILTHNIRCMSVCTINYIDHYGNKCVTEHVTAESWADF
jgi:hypothetical protein